jgi:hypothetical protein
MRCTRRLLPLVQQSAAVQIQCISLLAAVLVAVLVLVLLEATMVVLLPLHQCTQSRSSQTTRPPHHPSTSLSLFRWKLFWLEV